jgi:hypothetical protein
MNCGFGPLNRILCVKCYEREEIVAKNRKKNAFFKDVRNRMRSYRFLNVGDIIFVLNVELMKVVKIAVNVV